MRENGYDPEVERVILDRLDGPTRCLVELAVAIARGQEPEIEDAARAALAALVAPLWIDELLLQSVLIVGWPRALTGARVCRLTGFALAPGGEEGADYRQHEAWKSRGEETCRQVYGQTYPALRRNIHALHPALEAGMIVEGYGRIIGRPGLDLARRELCTIGQIAVQGARRQLRAHLAGALHGGATAPVVSQVLELVRPSLVPEEWQAIHVLWQRVQA